MPKIVLLGAGSTVFAKNLITDILSFPELSESTIALHDIDSDRLQTTFQVAQWICSRLGVNPQITMHENRQSALEDADYAIGMFQVGGYDPATITDFEIPKKFGLRQTIGDTLGIGGIMRALRTIPVYLEMCRDMEALCPDVYLLNYVNPMAMVTWAINRVTKIKTVGLCHSVQGTAEQLARMINVPLEEINYICAGINHMAFYLQFERDGEDLYPLVRKVIDEGRVPDSDRVRFDIFKRFGYFVTESSEHFAEYTPWFIKRNQPELIDKYNIPLDEYIRRCKVQIAGWKIARKKIENPNAEVDLAALSERLAAVCASEMEIEYIKHLISERDALDISHEYGAYIIHAIETDTPQVIYGNVMNEGLIKNLPPDCCVEVPCLVNRDGIQPTQIGYLPQHLAALIQTNINVQRLTVEAAVTGKRAPIYYAAMLDPHTGAELNLEEIWSLVDALLDAHRDWLPMFT